MSLSPETELSAGESASLACPMCGHPEQDDVFLSSNGYPIVRCRGCALVYTDDRKAPHASTLYPAFEQSRGALQRTVRASLGMFSRHRAAFVRAVKPHGRLLDYGCGSGAFARWMKGAGYVVVGLEPFSLGEPLEEAGLTLLRQPLESAESTLGTFDVITLWHVLEHVKNPVEVLTQLARHLAPDGRIIVSVPNFGSLQRTIFQGSWFHLDPPRHLLHFDDRTLRDCFRRAGLEPLEEKRFLPEYGSSGWVQSALNKVLPHKNFLFELVKDRGALRGMPKGESALHLATSVVLGAPVLAMSLPLEAYASARHEGAALTLAARRLG
jgi:SAM-dependent methyltransferase